MKSQIHEYQKTNKKEMSKAKKIIYWATTGIITAMMLFSAFGYFTNPDMKAAFVHLGFPDYFRIELGILKVLGALALILPMVSDKIKSFAYFGFALTFISAFIAHLASGDPISVAIMPIVFLVILAISYIFSPKIKA
ncbi:DoxX family protein [Pedobacter sp. CFBP9032]|uniref:DoxX family protein n=1 Tax=Pedobacter sp. CFBP9032 TaxID=3096539 RepID=UPI002A6B7004|nr:DoxX family protein [Pedobacter sp. CFBP9032]